VFGTDLCPLNGSAFSEFSSEIYERKRIQLFVNPVKFDWERLEPSNIVKIKCNRHLLNLQSLLEGITLVHLLALLKFVEGVRLMKGQHRFTNDPPSAIHVHTIQLTQNKTCVTVPPL
jgi:hypothetical protein